MAEEVRIENPPVHSKQEVKTGLEKDSPASSLFQTAPSANVYGLSIASIAVVGILKVPEIKSGLIT